MTTVNQYFEELKVEYPIADRLNKGLHQIATYEGSLNKIDICMQIENGLNYYFTGIKIDKNYVDKGSDAISCNFTASPYFDPDEFTIKYRYVLLIYTAILYPDFDKKGFYSRMSYSYDGSYFIAKSEQAPKKIDVILSEMGSDLNKIIRSFLDGYLGI